MEASADVYWKGQAKVFGMLPAALDLQLLNGTWLHWVSRFRGGSRIGKIAFAGSLADSWAAAEVSG